MLTPYFSKTILKNNFKKRYSRFGEGTADVEISAKAVKNAVQNAATTGQLDSNPNAATIADAMRSLGWVLRMNRDKRLSWQVNS